MNGMTFEKVIEYARRRIDEGREEMVILLQKPDGGSEMIVIEQEGSVEQMVGWLREKVNECGSTKYYIVKRRTYIDQVRAKEHIVTKVLDFVEDPGKVSVTGVFDSAAKSEVQFGRPAMVVEEHDKVNGTKSFALFLDDEGGEIDMSGGRCRRDVFNVWHEFQVVIDDGDIDVEEEGK